MDGVSVHETSYLGLTEAEKDASCCAECNMHSQCTFWERATDNHTCWLKSNPGDRHLLENRRGGYRGALRTSVCASVRSNIPA